MGDRSLGGVSVLVAGAGLAGLSAAADLCERGARVTLVEARARVGGRVWTVREGFRSDQHAEAGGDLIDEGQQEIRRLAKRLGLRTSVILRRGFAFAGRRAKGRPRTIRSGRAWATLHRHLEPLIREYGLADHRWDTTVAAAIARESVAAWLERVQAEEETRAFAAGLRGFFLADPDRLSLLALVDQFANDDTTGAARMYRVDAGNDRLAMGLGAVLGDRILLDTTLLAVSREEHAVRATIEARGTRDQIVADYLVVAMPATTLRDVPIEPPLPGPQRDAIVRLPYGSATKTLLQFERRFWRAPGTAKAYGTDTAIGAVWDANEHQRGAAGILALLAGGAASAETRHIVGQGGAEALAQQLDWLGRGQTRLIAHRIVSWEEDRWARGGYAYFDRDYDPSLRSWLARPCGRILFAGEHTSTRWQGYMNGAVESGLRAAAEVRVLASDGGSAIA